MLKSMTYISKRFLALFTLDVLTLVIAPQITLSLYCFFTGEYPDRYLVVTTAPLLFGLSLCIYPLSIYLLDQYDFQRDFRNLDSLVRLCGAVASAGCSLILLAYLLIHHNQSRLAFFIYNSLLVSGFMLTRILYSFTGSIGLYAKKALIVGCGDSGKAVVEELHRIGNQDIDVVGFIDRDPAKAGRTVRGIKIFLQEKTLREEVARFRPQILIIAMQRRHYAKMIKDIIWCAQQGVEIWDAPTTFERISGRIPLDFVDDEWLLYISTNKNHAYYRRIKRILDALAALAGLSLSAPFLAMIWLAIRLENNGPAILRQTRIGQNGRLFTLYKFRTMTQSKPQPGEKGTMAEDKRITRLGRVLRKLHVDELPQLVNVLRGDLSLIGPRAELLDFVEEYFGSESGLYCSELDLSDRKSRKNDEINPLCDRNIIPYFEQRFTVPQGITGWAQVKDPYSTSSHKDMLRKIEHDLYYIKNVSLALDILILFRTAKVMLFGRGK